VPVLAGDVEALAGAWGSSGDEADDTNVEALDGMWDSSDESNTEEEEERSVPALEGDVVILAGQWSSDEEVEVGNGPSTTAIGPDRGYSSAQGGRLCKLTGYGSLYARIIGCWIMNKLYYLILQMNACVRK
jgi:hypothetical protein